MDKSKGLPPPLRYPSSDIRSCLEQSKKIFSKSGSNYLHINSICADLELSEQGGHAGRLIASMKYYGILEPHTKDKTFKLSEYATNYSLNNDLTLDEIKFFINHPSINKKLFATYPLEEKYSSNGIKGFLIKSCTYNEKQANEFLQTHKKNIDLYNSKVTNNTINSNSHTKQLTDNKKVIKTSETQISDETELSFPLGDNDFLKLSFPKNLTAEKREIIDKSFQFALQAYIKENK